MNDRKAAHNHMGDELELALGARSIYLCIYLSICPAGSGYINMHLPCWGWIVNVLGVCVCARALGNMRTYLYTYILIYINTYIHTCIHTYIHTDIHTYIVN